MVIRLAIVECLFGTKDAKSLLREEELTAKRLPLDCSVDARSVFDGVTAVVVNPSDKALWLPTLALRQLLDRGIIRKLYWTDTRDMCADGLNKGIINRDDIRLLMSTGIWKVEHEHKSWSRDDIKAVK